MSYSIDRIAAALVLALLFFASPAFMQGEQEMSPKEKSMMEAWTKASSPNKNHKRLAQFVGTWNFTTKWWMERGAEPKVSEGTARYEMLMGGRYLKETVKSQMADGAFEGLGLTGYDNVKKAYVSNWIDNMGTGIMVSEGSWDQATKSFNWTGEYMDAMTGRNKKMRMVTHVTSPDRFVAEFFEQGPGGREFRSMEITYTRK